jgi:hypothetical protein
MLDGAGIVGVVVVTPWLGVYAVAVTLKLLGMRRLRIQGAILLSLTVYAVIIAAATVGLLG